MITDDNNLETDRIGAVKNDVFAHTFNDNSNQDSDEEVHIPIDDAEDGESSFEERHQDDKSESDNRSNSDVIQKIKDMVNDEGESSDNYYKDYDEDSEE